MYMEKMAVGPEVNPHMVSLGIVSMDPSRLEARHNPPLSAVLLEA